MEQNQLGFGSLFDFIIAGPYQAGMRYLTVVVGFSSAAMIRQLIYEYPDLKLKLIIGMALQSGISDADHITYCELVKKFPERLEVMYYAGRPSVHAKLYIWGRSSKPDIGIVTSANLSWSGLQSLQEIGIYTPPTQMMEVYNTVRNKSITVISQEASKVIRIFEATTSSARDVTASHGTIKPFPAAVRQTVSLSLLTGTGEIHTKSGLNWGQREGRNPNQAYIPIPASTHQEYPGFFPPRKHRFTVKTDDGMVLTCVVAQDNDKAIETPDDNSSLGLYFRKRLGVASGEFVELSDVMRYGRTNIDFVKIDEDMYLMDFSKPTTV